MATKHQQMQRIIHQFKYETGKKEVDMHDVVKWAIAHGWPLPTPADHLNDWHRNSQGRPGKRSATMKPPGSPTVRTTQSLSCEMTNSPHGGSTSTRILRAKRC